MTNTSAVTMILLKASLNANLNIGPKQKVFLAFAINVHNWQDTIQIADTIRQSSNWAYIIAFSLLHQSSSKYSHWNRNFRSLKNVLLSWIKFLLIFLINCHC